MEVKVSGSQEDALKVLERVEGVKRVRSVQTEEDHTVVQLEVADEDEALMKIPESLKKNGIRLIGIQVALPTLEEVFMSLTGGEKG